MDPSALLEDGVLDPIITTNIFYIVEDSPVVYFQSSVSSFASQSITTISRLSGPRKEAILSEAWVQQSSASY